jgi:hypothetical protein
MWTGWKGQVIHINLVGNLLVNVNLEEREDIGSIMPRRKETKYISLQLRNSVIHICTTNLWLAVYIRNRKKKNMGHALCNNFVYKYILPLSNRNLGLGKKFRPFGIPLLTQC